MRWYKYLLHCLAGHCYHNTGSKYAGLAHDQMGYIPGSSQLYYEKECCICKRKMWNANPHNYGSVQQCLKS